MNATLQRWHAFLEKVHVRVHEILAEATAGCTALFESEQHDPRAMSNAWGAMQRRAEELVTKIGDTWNASVDDELGHDPALRTAERERGEAVAEQLTLAIEAAKRRLWADSARTLWHCALAEAPTSLRCTQCSASMPVPNATRATNVPCSHCGAMVSYEPGTKLRMIEHFAVPALCDEGTWQEWLALRAAIRGRRGHDGDRIENLRRHEHAQIAHERAWLELRARMLPEHAAALATDLHGRLAAFYQSLDRERAWIEAGRPRALAQPS